MLRFETFDISSDAGIRAFGDDLSELFANAAIGLYSLIIDLKDIQEKKTLEISAQGSSLEGLLVSFLNELIFHFDTYGFIGKGISIEGLQAGELAGFEAGKPASLPAYALNAVLTGEEFDSARHEGKLLIKAATYHELKVHRKAGHWEAEVILDI